MRKYLLAAALLAILVAPAYGQGRPDTRAMSCGEVRSLLQQRGAAVLSTGRHTFDRYVANERFCRHPDTAVRASVPARDTASCRVYRCELVVRNDFFWRLGR